MLFVNFLVYNICMEISVVLYLYVLYFLVLGGRLNYYWVMYIFIYVWNNLFNMICFFIVVCDLELIGGIIYIRFCNKVIKYVNKLYSRYSEVVVVVNI